MKMLPAWLLVSLIIIGAVWYYFQFFFRGKARKASFSSQSRSPAVSPSRSTKRSTSGKLGQQKLHARHGKSRGGKGVGGGSEKVSGVLSSHAVQSHPLLVNSIKGSGTRVTCAAIDPEGRRFVVACADSSVRVMDIDLEIPDAASHTTTASAASSNGIIRGVLECMEVATAIDFAADGESIFAALEYRTNLTRLRIAPDAKGKCLQAMMKSDDSLHKSCVRKLISSKGRWILTAGEENDTAMKLWSYSGDILATCDTKQIRNAHINVSPMDGRFFGSAAWTAGVKVWEVCTQKQGDFKKVERAMDLKTTCGTVSLAFSPDNKRAVIATKDGRIIMWNIDVRYKVSEDPKEIISVQEVSDDFRSVTELAFSSDGSRVIMTSDTNLKIYDSENLDSLAAIPNAHASPIVQILVPRSRSCFITTAAGEKARMWSLP